MVVRLQRKARHVVADEPPADAFTARLAHAICNAVYHERCSCERARCDGERTCSSMIIAAGVAAMMTRQHDEVCQ